MLYNSFVIVFTALFSCFGLIACEYNEPEVFDADSALAKHGITFKSYSHLSQNDTCVSACAVLAFAFRDQTIPNGSPAIGAWASNFWSLQQASVTPSCVFQPLKSNDVAVAVLVSRKFRCPFAVKSGGHAAFRGASNVDGGITIDLAKLNKIDLTEDGKVARVGAGNTWSRVYSTLEEHQLAVVGGRVADIGVGGFTLGGGLSFHSGSRGWGCDNVATYELVTAAGDILSVNQYSYPDLYWALRGGGSNFGIVTHFSLDTFPQGPIWGGSRVYNATTYGPHLIKAFVNFGNNPDEHAATWLSFGTFQGAWIMSILLMHSTPIPNPPIFDEYNDIPHIEGTDTTKIRSLADLTLETNSSNPKGLRETSWSHTFKLDSNLIELMTQSYAEEFINVPGLTFPLVLQLVTKQTLARMRRNGVGNATPLPEDEDAGPFMILQLCPMWLAEQDDNTVIGSVVGILDNVVAKAKKWGLYLDYFYMNYASEYQDVLHSYSEENYGRLKSVALKYDPKGVFQELNPGYFKFGGPPKMVFT